MDSRNLLCGHCGPRIATFSCKRCNLLLCPECLVEGRCPACARELAQRRQRRRRLILTLAAGFVPGIIMAGVVGAGYSHHGCCRSTSQCVQLLTSARADLHKLVVQDTAAPPVRKAHTPPVRRADDPVPVTVDNGPAPIQRAGPGRYVVDRRGAARILSNPLSQGTRVVPVHRDGRMFGFKLYRIRNGSPYHRLGLRNGDVVQRINGIAIRSPEQAITVYNRLRKADRITLQVRRQGTPRTLRYWITEA